MTNFRIPTIPTYSTTQKQRDKYIPICTLKWRQKELLVGLEQQVKQPHLPSLESNQWLAECLRHSPVRLICIEPELGEASLKIWADACEQANKSVFLRLPAAHQLPSKRCPRSWWLKRMIDWSAAALLLLILSPVMLGLIFLMLVHSPQPIFCQRWCVGERGKLFRLLKFRTMEMNAQTLQIQMIGNQKGQQKHKYAQIITPLGRWMHKYSLDELPQLFNVLWGEMSLVGPRPWALCDAARISPERRQQMNALPGIIGPKQLEARSNLSDLNAVNRCNLEYLHNWSLWQDLKVLLLTMPKGTTKLSSP